MIDLRAPLFFLLLLLPGFIAGGIKLSRPGIRFWKTYSVTLVGCVAVFFFIFFGPFVDVKRNKTFEMNWELGEPVKEYPGDTHVILTFTRYPNHFTGYYSSELADYLKSKGKKTVDVTFEVTSDFGKMRGYREVRFGDHVLKRAPANSYGGDRGLYLPSPWLEN